MKTDCKYWADVECTYHKELHCNDDCDKYEKDERKHPLDDSDQADYLRDMKKDMGEI